MGNPIARAFDASGEDRQDNTSAAAQAPGPRSDA
jgi:hypothetical protein